MSQRQIIFIIPLAHNTIMMIKKILFTLFLSILLLFPTTFLAQEATPYEALSPPQFSLDVEYPKELYYGDTITLIARIEYQDNYSIIWQCSSNGIDWTNINCTDTQYSFILSEENQFYYYRFVIII